MSHCPRCGSRLDPAGRPCSTCGLDPGAPTDPGERIPSTLGDGSIPSAASSRAEGGARFVAGTILAGRYRIISLAGRGGMGEVYRADDLRLGQRVALKFLPEAIASDPRRQERFLAEVRISRQVSHPHVCRVYDIAEAEGLLFLSMELVEGEDLGSLLRRIGRLPQAKAVDVARQLCEGIAAAHEQGVLHRDLKPANVMIDAHGNVRLTDFGVAAVAGEVVGDRLIAGTPGYIAPEILSGSPPSVQSDLYALGLVLYEMFTGRARFEAPTLRGPDEGITAITLAETRPKERPSSGTPAAAGPGEASPKDEATLHPAVEQVILRCLAPDPAARPRSALAVAAALPGGDPLAAAIEAGETPSPSLVAAAGHAGGLRPGVASACLAGILLATAIVVTGSKQAMLVRIVPLPKPPDVLADRAREILRVSGVTDPPASAARGFDLDFDQMRWVEREDRSVARWAPLGAGRMPGITFWYREGSRPLRAVRMQSNGRVQAADPPLTAAGMSLVRLDPAGRLAELTVVPGDRASLPPVEAEAGPSSPPAEDPWLVLFRGADLDPSAFRSVEPSSAPPVFVDRRAAWEGTLPGRPEFPVRIEAGALSGHPVFFRIKGPWERGPAAEPAARRVVGGASRYAALSIFLAAVVGGVALAWWNVRVQRGDRRGAARLAAYVFAVSIGAWLAGANHAPSMSDEIVLLMDGLGYALFGAGLMGVLYLGLEPYVRRTRPHMILSWSRLLAGRWNDPLVGQDVLVGSLLGAGLAAIDPLYHRAPGWLGIPPQMPHTFEPGYLLGPGSVIATLLEDQRWALVYPLILCFVLVLLRMLLRRTWAAAAAFIVVTAFFGARGGGPSLINLAYAALEAGVITFTLLRCGLLALIALSLVNGLILAAPITTDPSSWYAGSFLFLMGLIAGLSVLALRITVLRASPARKRTPA